MNDPACDRDTLLRLDDRELTSACVMTFTKGTGNGGQHRNKTASAVRLRHRATGIEATDCSERSQHRNRAIALRKLRLNMALALRVHPAGELPRLRCALDHPDYPLWVARLLDHLEEQHWELKATAGKTGHSPSSLLKLIARDPALCQYVNTRRTASGLPALIF